MLRQRHGMSQSRPEAPQSWMRRPSSNPCTRPLVSAACALQVLQLKDERGQLAAVLDNDARKLGYYSPRDGWTLHIIDTDPTSLSGEGRQGGWNGRRKAGAAARLGLVLGAWGGFRERCTVPSAGPACARSAPSWLPLHRARHCHAADAARLLAANGWLEDVGKVEKYVMSDEAYAARDNTYRKYKEVRWAPRTAAGWAVQHAQSAIV